MHFKQVGQIDLSGFPGTHKPLRPGLKLPMQPGQLPLSLQCHLIRGLHHPLGPFIINLVRGSTQISSVITVSSMGTTQKNVISFMADLNTRKITLVPRG